MCASIVRRINNNENDIQYNYLDVTTETDLFGLIR